MGPGRKGWPAPAADSRYGEQCRGSGDLAHIALRLARHACLSRHNPGSHCRHAKCEHLLSGLMQVQRVNRNEAHSRP